MLHLDLQGRVQVVEGRAEQLAHEPVWRHSFSLVVARSFGPPGLTAECATGFLRVGGLLVVSEPPDPVDDRWPAAGLALLGLRAAPQSADLEGPHFQILEQHRPCPARFPRRVGVPAKRPLF